MLVGGRKGKKNLTTYHNVEATFKKIPQWMENVPKPHILYLSGIVWFYFTSMKYPINGGQY